MKKICFAFISVFLILSLNLVGCSSPLGLDNILDIINEGGGDTVLPTVPSEVLAGYTGSAMLEFSLDGEDRLLEVTGETGTGVFKQVENGLYYLIGDEKIFIDPENPGFETRLCNVDAALVKGENITAVFEIEESDDKPTKICGKFLTTALAKAYCRGKTERKCLPENSVVFIQVIKTGSKHKIGQIEKIQSLLNEITKIQSFVCVKSYHVVCFDGNERTLKNELRDILKKESDL